MLNSTKQLLAAVLETVSRGRVVLHPTTNEVPRHLDDGHSRPCPLQISGAQATIELASTSHGPDYAGRKVVFVCLDSIVHQRYYIFVILIVFINSQSIQFFPLSTS